MKDFTFATAAEQGQTTYSGDEQQLWKVKKNVIDVWKWSKNTTVTLSWHHKWTMDGCALHYVHVTAVLVKSKLQDSLTQMK